LKLEALRADERRRKTQYTYLKSATS